MRKGVFMKHASSVSVLETTVSFGSVCSGIEAASVAWEPLGFKASWFSEIEPFPCAVLKHHWPEVINLGDMTKIRDRIADGEVYAPDVLVGGTPCFTAGHLVLTEDGYMPIELVQPGMNVVSHTGRLQKVLRVGSKLAGVGRFSAVGLPAGIECTPEHPFRSVDFERKNTRREGVYARVERLGDAEWMPACNMKGKQWCALLNYQIQQPEIKSSKFTDAQAMYVAGVYLGDGHIRKWKGKNKKAVILSINNSKLEKLSKHIDLSEVYIAKERTSVRPTIHDTIFAEWLTGNFGTHSKNKKIPAWCLSSPYMHNLLQGYLDSDGSGCNGRYTANSVSKSLAFGVADLANACGFASSVAFIETPDTTIIEGRTVNQSDYWQVRMVDRGISRKSRVRHDMLLRLAQGYEETHTDTVFNIEVEGDNSYVLNGAIVHNCQAFSVAGARKSLDDDRGQLTLEYVRLLNEIDTARSIRGDSSAIAVWENVHGVLSTKDNAFGCFLGALAGEDCELKPSGKKWTNAGCVFGPQRTVAWRVLDAQHFGVAQRRRRVFVVASARKDINPVEILFEFDGVRRDSAPSRSTGQDVAKNTDSGFAESSFAQFRPVSGDGGTLRSKGGTVGIGGENLVVKTVSGKDIFPPLQASDGSKIWLNNQSAFSGDYFINQPKNKTMHVVHGSQDPITQDNTAFPIGRNHGQENAILFEPRSADGVPRISTDQTLCPTLNRMGGGQREPCIATKFVRRLTPLECERLQGFPDNYTLIPLNKRRKLEVDMLAYIFLHRPSISEDQARYLATESPRYSACGNSMPVPVMRWIGKRILNAIKQAQI